MLAIKKKFPAREAYLVTGVIASIGVAGALAAIVSAHSLKDQSAIMPTKVVQSDNQSKAETAPQQASEMPAEEYTTSTSPRKVAGVPSVSPEPLAESPAVSISPVPSPTITPEPTPEPTPEVSPEPEL